MFINDPLNALADSLAHARYEGFRPIQDDRHPRRPRRDEIEVVAMFPQMWGSTALGFGGVGGQAMTTAYTVILTIGRGEHLVYFGGRFAYEVTRPNSQFSQDVMSKNMKKVRESDKYER